jgi:predicted metalloprotease
VALVAVLVLGAACDSGDDDDAGDGRDVTTRPRTERTLRERGEAETSTSEGSEDGESVLTVTTGADDGLEGEGSALPDSCGLAAYDAVVCAALAEVDAFWVETFPDVYGEEYFPITGGFHPYTSDSETPPCGDPPPRYDEIAENAFYCPSADLVAWDDELLIPALWEQFGDLTLGIVFAHEWGHAIQARVAARGDTILLENQADCFAGAWAADVATNGSPSFVVDDESLNLAVAGFLTLGDTPGTPARDPSAHGSAFDRVSGFQDGFENGTGACALYPDSPPTFTEMEFGSEADFVSGGELDYAVLHDELIADQEAYWAEMFPVLFDEAWTPVSAHIPYDPRARDVPACGGEQFPRTAYRGVMYYCAADDYIAWDEATFIPRLYDQIGDFAVGALFANTYTQAVAARLGITELSAEDRAVVDCLTGTWARTLWDRSQQPEPPVDQLSLSPGDLDEGIAAFLAFGDTPPDVILGEQEPARAFDRIADFRLGFFNGVDACFA